MMFLFSSISDFHLLRKKKVQVGGWMGVTFIRTLRTHQVNHQNDLFSNNGYKGRKPSLIGFLALTSSKCFYISAPPFRLIEDCNCSKHGLPKLFFAEVEFQAESSHVRILLNQNNPLSHHLIQINIQSVNINTCVFLVVQHSASNIRYVYKKFYCSSY